MWSLCFLSVLQLAEAALTCGVWVGAMVMGV